MNTNEIKALGQNIRVSSFPLVVNQRFLKGEAKEVSVSGTRNKVKHDPFQRPDVGKPRLGASEAVAIGALCAPES